MTAVLEMEIARMSRAEKMHTMEVLWSTLEQSTPEIESPAWHESALMETQKRLDSGEEKISEWRSAKRALRKEFDEN